MDFYNKLSSCATVSKKGNLSYWDAIDELTEEYVRNLLAFSNPEVQIDEEDEDDIVLELGKEITEFATKLLEERLNAEFPYVDENY